MQCRLPFPLRTRTLLSLLAACAIALPAGNGLAQNVPLISGGVGVLSETNGGSTFFQPITEPVIAAPLGSHLLVESRGALFNTFQENSEGKYQSAFLATLQFLQLDYVATPRLTIVAGKFITPFGTYNERMSPIWVPNFQDAPLSFGIGTRSSGTSNGGMVRGVALSGPKAQLNYTGYVSGSSSVHEFAAARTAGMQAAGYFPDARLEVGMSYQRFLQQVHTNSWGMHVWWMPANTGYELRSEYSHGARSEGYWIENAYRLSRFGGRNSFVGRFEPLFRFQEAIRNLPNLPGESDGLPGVTTKQADFGLDYHLPQELRLNTSYSRTFPATGVDKNIWDISLTYRFLFPAWRGGK
jgi:hypothetical protein